MAAIVTVRARATSPNIHSSEVNRSAAGPVLCAVWVPAAPLSWGLGEGLIVGSRPEMLPTLASEPLGLTPVGVGLSRDGAAGGLEVAAGVRAWAGVGEALAATAPLTPMDADASGSVVIDGLAAASAAAVSVIDLTATASEATRICACIW